MLTRPHFSAALTAHLAKPAGGRGIGTDKGGKPAPLFADKQDADFRAMLGAIEEGRRRMRAHPRADMAGFGKPAPREPAAGAP